MHQSSPPTTPQTMVECNEREGPCFLFMCCRVNLPMCKPGNFIAITGTERIHCMLKYRALCALCCYITSLTFVNVQPLSRRPRFKQQPRTECCYEQ